MNVARFRTAVVSLCLALASSVAFAQGDGFIGTWVLNAAKSTFPPGGQPDSMTIVVSDAGGGKLKSVSAITMSGFAVNGEVTFAVDGQDYVPTSTPPAPAGMAITQSSERVSDNAYKTSVKVNGEVMTTMLNELSADGQTLTVSSTGAGPTRCPSTTAPASSSTRSRSTTASRATSAS